MMQRDDSINACFIYQRFREELPTNVFKFSDFMPYKLSVFTYQNTLGKILVRLQDHALGAVYVFQNIHVGIIYHVKI